MKILQVTQSYVPVSGGLQQIVHDLAIGLSAAGETVQVVTQRYPRTLPASEQRDGIPIRRLYFIRPSWHYLRQRRADLLAFGMFAAPRTQWQFAQIVRKFAPDVVHFHYPQHLIPFVLPILRDHAARLVVSFHGVEIDEAQRGSASDRKRLHHLLDRADRVTAVSRAALQQVIAFQPDIAAKATVVYNGLQESAFVMPTPDALPARPYILGAGRLVTPKGFDLLIEAFAGLAADFPGVDLWLAGDGEARPTLEAQAHSAGVGARVRFMGNVTRGRVAQMIRGSQCVMIPSRAETFGLVALEAMALERRVIAACVGGLPELLDTTATGSENQLVEPAADAIRTALTVWLGDPTFRVQSSINRQWARDFSIDSMVKRYRDVYKGNRR